MADKLRKVFLVNQTTPHNKYYDMIENKDGTFTSYYGRIGAKAQTKIYPGFKWSAIYYQKTSSAKGYHLVTFEGVEPGAIVKFDHWNEVAQQGIVIEIRDRRVIIIDIKSRTRVLSLNRITPTGIDISGFSGKLLLPQLYNRYLDLIKKGVLVEKSTDGEDDSDETDK